jgi:hypothetical protein
MSGLATGVEKGGGEDRDARRTGLAGGVRREVGDGERTGDGLCAAGGTSGGASGLAGRNFDRSDGSRHLRRRR